jgi:hypothetical protein
MLVIICVLCGLFGLAVVAAGLLYAAHEGDAKMSELFAKAKAEEQRDEQFRTGLDQGFHFDGIPNKQSAPMTARGGASGIETETAVAAVDSERSQAPSCREGIQKCQVGPDEFEASGGVESRHAVSLNAASTRPTSHRHAGVAPGPLASPPPRVGRWDTDRTSKSYCGICGRWGFHTSTAHSI